MFFQSWAGLGRTALAALQAYAALVVMLRVSGKRTLSKMNAFDLIVTVALGSTLATVILSKDIALAEGLTAFATLIALQFVITWLSVRSPKIAQFVKAEPTLLLHQGEFLRAAMKRERVVETEMRAAIRSQGVAAVEQVYAVVLETDGSFTVIPQTDDSAPPSAIAPML